MHLTFVTPQLSLPSSHLLQLLYSLVVWNTSDTNTLYLQVPFTDKHWYSILHKHCQYKRTLTISACY